MPATSGSARFMRAKTRATLSWRWRVSIPRSVTRSRVRAIPISRPCGFRGGAASSSASGAKKRPAVRSRLRLRAAIDAYALPGAWLEAMLDARLQEIAPQDDFNLAAFHAFADESEGARLRLAARIAAGGHDLDEADAHAPAGIALALTRLLYQLPFKAGAAPTLIPADVAARHGASAPEFDARRASPGVVAACAELRGLAREELRAGGAPVESLAAGDPAGLCSARRLAPRSRSARPQRRAPVRPLWRSLPAQAAMGDLALGASAMKVRRSRARPPVIASVSEATRGAPYVRWIASSP